MSNKQKSTFIRCCYGYSISGLAVLVIGAVLPSVMREASLNYTLAGGMLSMMAIGNLLASFFFPVLVGAVGMKRAITMTSFLVPISYFTLSLLPGTGVLYVLMLAAGIGRGSVTIVNNTTVNVISNNSAKSLNLLHCSFAIGALLAPFITAMMLGAGLGWRSAIYLAVALTLSSAISYSFIDYSDVEQKSASKEENAKQAKKEASATADRSFLKNFCFYCIAFMLFFYLGTENCINGWFVTYLQSTGTMSETYATSMVSVTWLTILFGRLICASLSNRYKKSTLILINAIGSGICLVLLLSASHLATITAAMVGLGFFLAGIYPTAIADAGQYTKGSTLGMSLLTAISALGGIITPQIIGIVADSNTTDHSGIVGAFSILCFNALMVVILAAINAAKNRKQEAK